MKVNEIVSHRIVMSEDLNHHKTLYAGRAAEWFVETGLMAAAQHLPAENIVCVKIHEMTFKRPVLPGEIIRLCSKIVFAGRTSVVANIDISVDGEQMVNGFITFVNVDEEGRAFPHGVTIEAISEEDILLQEEARKLYESN
ncbi:MAG: hotdog domain-containing protein [Eubacteriales bacterium]|nr:hotdog domain-containing protein [Eubacteriales bacterium]MDD4323611.1 hotdog domain-containing protein [Eubacteriales bacterium]MDD4540755.1 hotdog domain-containing protein [Eubacteriales bacterium]